MQFWKHLSRQCIKMLQRKGSCFLIKKLPKSSQFCYLETGPHPSVTDFVEAMSTLIQERLNPNESCITAEVSRRTQKFEIYLANEGSGLAVFGKYMGHFFGSNVGNDLEWCCEKDLTNQKLLRTLPTCNLSWYTRTWLSTLSLETRKPHCCVAFFSFQS